MRRYENIVIISPDCKKEEEDELLSRIKTGLEKAGANVIRMDDWGVRRFAYPIRRNDKGHYLFFLLDMDENGVGTLNRFYKNIDLILRHMIVGVDEKYLGPEKPPEQVVFDELEGEFV